VSPLHAGFIVNTGNATAGDVIDLMRVVQETVLDRFGVMLEPEVRIVGE
jgi:UDP-N-acetylmuramate dehydrogenase